MGGVNCECASRGMTGGKAHPLCPVHGHLHDTAYPLAQPAASDVTPDAAGPHIDPVVISTGISSAVRQAADWEQFLVMTRKLGWRDDKVEAIAQETGYDRDRIWRILTERS